MSARYAALLCLLPAIVSLGACRGMAPDQNTAMDLPTPGWQACQGERPKVCTMMYDPVCGRRTDGALAVYASPCNACADVAVVTWHPEPCEE